MANNTTSGDHEKELPIDLSSAWNSLASIIVGLARIKYFKASRAARAADLRIKRALINFAFLCNNALYEVRRYRHHSSDLRELI